MRIVLCILLFQFLSPSFMAVASRDCDADTQRSLALHIDHNTIPVSPVLKEKEENEFEENITGLALIQLIDFSTHSFGLTQFHQLKCNSKRFEERRNHQPALFTLFCAYII